EDGIRDLIVTGVQTCALPIFPAGARRVAGTGNVAGARGVDRPQRGGGGGGGVITIIAGDFKNRRLKTPTGDKTRPTASRVREARSEERRVGKEGREWGEGGEE